jgi:3-hydroxybutyryl-CoA dehydratase
VSNDLGVEPGDGAEFAKTITAADIDGFAAITGDNDPIHMDEAYAAGTAYGRRIAHGMLVMGLLSTASSLISRKAVERGAKGVPVSLGYDRIRFVRPAFIGDRLTARYRIEAIDPARRRSRSRVEVVNQNGETVVAGEHIMKWVG